MNESSRDLNRLNERKEAKEGRLTSLMFGMMMKMMMMEAERRRRLDLGFFPGFPLTQDAKWKIQSLKRPSVSSPSVVDTCSEFGSYLMPANKMWKLLLRTAAGAVTPPFSRLKVTLRVN